MSLSMGYRVKALEERVAKLEQGTNFNALRRLKDLEKQYFDLLKLVNEHHKVFNVTTGIAQGLEKRG